MSNPDAFPASCQTLITYLSLRFFALQHSLRPHLPQTDFLEIALKMVLPSASSTAPLVHFTHPPSSLLWYKPGQNPQALSPSSSDHTLARPFAIPTDLYNNALHVAIPITVALVYTAVVSEVNKINADRKHKPWAFSKSLVFWALVVVHNVFLALYSGWTFIGMLNAIRQSWPGLDGQHGFAGAADALCKMQGPRGLGSATTYNTSTSAWGFTDRAMKLAGDIPDSTDVGRIWNEGLAFYGWLFYLSKFYEMLDTAIILIKGKKSSVLQTFHHAGAMLCMWAGIRYMSPPIWMFVFINSFLHTIMVSTQVPIDSGRVKSLIMLSTPTTPSPRLQSEFLDP